MKISNAKNYLDLYNIEDYLFKAIGSRIRERSFVEFDDFYQICMWKSARQKQNYLKNKNTIKDISKKAFAEKDKSLKMKQLLELKGVGIPTASATLTIVFPEKYAVIDARCIQMLNKVGIKIKETITINRWLEYLNIMRELANENNFTPRQIDQILFSMHREMLEKNNFQNLYSKP
jgi:thermostable 8-oxoguanine DNA glycosylase